MQNFYEILGIDPNASIKEVRWAYRRLTFICHPDRNPDDPSAEGIQRLANEAYRVLSDPGARAEYDHTIFGTPLSPDNNVDEFAYAQSIRPNPSMVGIWLKEMALLSLALAGALPCIFLCDLFIPHIAFISLLIIVWGSSVLLGGIGRTMALRFGASQTEFGIIGTLLGMGLAVVFVSPEDDSFAFLAMVKVIACAASAGWLAGTIMGRLGTRLPLKPVITLAVVTFAGAALGMWSSGARWLAF